MEEAKKYKVMSIAIILIALYISVTEVWDRWVGTFQQYREMKQKNESLLDPEKVLRKKKDLLAEKKYLELTAVRASGKYEQSETGVIDFLNTCAKHNNIRFESLTPMSSQQNGAQIKEVGFKLEFASDYHKAASFINEAETEAMPLRIKRLDINADSPASNLLHVDIEGTSEIVSVKEVK